jgi:hypothetical protein
MRFVNKIFAISITQAIITIIVHFIIRKNLGIKHGYKITGFMQRMARISMSKGSGGRGHSYTIT